MEQTVLNYYKEYGFPSISTLLKILKENKVDVKKAVVDKVLKAYSVYQLHKKKQKKYKGHLVAYRENHIWQMDLLDMQKYSSVNKGYKYILLVIDIFTRKALATPLKSKSTDPVVDAFEKILKDQGIPDKIITDNGSEFINSKMQDIMNSDNILHQTVEVGYHPALGIIDRLSRTIKEKIEKSFTDTRTAKWLDVLPKLIKSYNNTPHSALNDITPNKVKDNIEQIRNINVEKNQANVHETTKISPNQLVRVRLVKPLFTKGYKQEWSNAVYTIKKVNGINATLDDGNVVKLSNLQFVVAISEPTKENVQQKKVERKYKTVRKVEQEGLTVKDIRKGLRERKPQSFVQDDKYGTINW